MMNSRAILVLFCCLTLSSIVSGCTGETGTDNCVAGEQSDCGCPDGQTGVQVCGDDGTFEPCDCPGLDAGIEDSGSSTTDDADDSEDAGGGDETTDTGSSDAGGEDTGSGDTGSSDTGTADTGSDDTGGGDGGGDDGYDCDSVPTAGTRDTSSCCVPSDDRYGPQSPWLHFTDFDTPFPGDNNQVLFTVQNDHYLAIEFEAPPADAEIKGGYISTVLDSHALNTLHTIAYSRCPGDFNEALPDSDCRAYAASHQFWWSVYGEYSDSACELDPGETHYINIKYASGEDVDENTCDSENNDYCGALFSIKQWDP